MSVDVIRALGQVLEEKRASYFKVFQRELLDMDE